jgi:hypothetical protein
MSTPYQKQAVKCINQFVAEADGNWYDAKVALDNWCVEVLALGEVECVESWRIFVYCLDDAWMSMRPLEMANAKP